MTPRGLTGALALAGLSLGLGGCVAAAAIPIVAGGALGGREVLGKDKKPDPVPEIVKPPFDGPQGQSAPAEPAATPLPASPVETEAVVEARPGAGVAPPPAPPPPPPPPVEAPMNDEAPAFAPLETPASETLSQMPRRIVDYGGFYAYASDEAKRDPVDEARDSAILASPGSLTPKTTECAILPPAVLIDLDPGDATADLGAVAPDPELADALDKLRKLDVAVYWISAASAGDAGTLRTRLRDTGLDPLARDGLLLMRRPEDRKQVRRRELSQTHCVVAILGDRRSDFDELFAYLKNPSAASGLDALIGNGWFLTTSSGIPDEK